MNGICSGELIYKSSNWKQIEILKITISCANWQFLEIGKDCQIVIFSLVYTKHQGLLICDEHVCTNIYVAHLTILHVYKS